jgi:hypothetical protein
MSTVKIDGSEYDISDPTDEVKVQLQNLKFVSEQLLQRNNELQIAETAKIGYTRALRRELDKIES